MKTLGWKLATVRIDGTTMRAFVKGDEAHARHQIAVAWSDTQRQHVVVPQDGVEKRFAGASAAMGATT